MRVNSVSRSALLTVMAAGLLGGGLLTALPAQADVSVAAARTALAQAAVPGTAVGSTGKHVLITVDQTVTGAKYDKLAAAVRDYGSNAVIKRTTGTFRPLIAGGDAVYGGGYRCSLGFGVTDGQGGYGFVDAGHCGNVISTWYSDSGQSNEIGYTVDSQFPDNDFSLVQSEGTQPSGTVDLYNGSSQDITSSGDPTVGERVTRSGSTSGVHTGTVEALNTSVYYQGDGQVNGLIQTNVCAEPGDSGGPLFDGSKALGLTSGGSGDCTSGGQTFFQPVQEALDHYGVTVD